MAIHCPYCAHVMALKGAKPGRFQPRCPACHEKFALVIPDDPSMAPSVKQIAHGKDSHEAITPDVATALGIAPPPPAPKPKATNVTMAPSSAAQTTGATQPSGDASSIASSVVPPPPATRPPASVPAKVDSKPPTQVRSTTRTSYDATLPPAPAKPVSAKSEPVGLSAPPQDFNRAQHPAEEATLSNPVDDLRGRLGGYDIVQRLGAGGMGAVYLARQVSLDRNVALKVLAPNLAGDPSFVARFTREAYAAAQLTHHNVVQIYDIGQDRDINYFSMEFVDGQTLSNLVRETGKVDPEAAVGHILQAARGLKFAHDHGLIHRDIKPDNLLLNDQGIVKVADLGLVKRTGVEESLAPASDRPAQPGNGSADQTQLNVSMGTPAYMPPEQADDAAHVDGRADIYSLGCTLYDLLTGHPPFEGKTALEVITKHQREQIVPPDRLVKNVPRHLSDMLLKMVAKRPDQRYQTMGEVIKDLEDFLGVETGPSGAFTPKEEHARILEIAVAAYNTSGMGVLRSQLILAFYVLCLIGFGVTLWYRSFLLAGGLIGFAVLTFLTYQITQGIFQKTTLFSKARQLVFGAGIVDWLMGVAICGVGVMLLFVTGQLGPWIGGAILAVLVAQGFYWGVDLLVAKDRRPRVEQVEKLLRQMRLRGLDEDSVRKFVSKYSGNHWEAFYEELFGYDDKLRARELWGKGEKGRDRKKYAAWRDAIIRWIEAKLKGRKESRERKLLAKIEAKVLASKGINEKLAKKQARKNADKMVAKAEKLRISAARDAAAAAAPPPPKSAGLKATLAPTLMPGAISPNVLHGGAGALLDADEEKPGEEIHREHESYLRRRYGGPLDILFGGKIRFFLAIAILAGFALWWNQKGEAVINGALDVAGRQREIKIEDSGRKVTDQIVNASKQLVRETGQINVDTSNMRPLQYPWLPTKISDMVSSYNALAAGLLLLISSFLRGKLMSVLVLLGCVVVLIGYADWVGLPFVMSRAWLAAAIGSALAIFGMIFFREAEGY